HVTHLSDPALVRRTLQGDTTAFGTLVERHKQVVYGVCVNLLGATLPSRKTWPRTPFSRRFNTCTVSPCQSALATGCALLLATNASYTCGRCMPSRRRAGRSTTRHARVMPISPQ